MHGSRSGAKSKATSARRERSEQQEIVRPVIIGTPEYHYSPPDNDTRIASFSIDDRALTVVFRDGRRLEIPLSWFPILKEANPKDREDFEVGWNGKVVWFDRLNTEVSVDQMLACFRPADEEAFLSLCATSDRLAYDIAALAWRAAKESGLPPDRVLERALETLKQAGPKKGP
jgi:hypothetical protein